MDPASLAIGVAGVVATFDSCMSAFHYIQSGKSFGKDYQKAILKINILSLKLSRWGQSVQLVDDPSQLPQDVKLASEQDRRTVEELLGQILDDLSTAERVSSRYKSNVLEPGDILGYDSVESLTVKTRQLALSRQRAASLKQKAKWALHHKGKLADLIDDLDSSIKALTELFPSAQPKQKQLALQEAQELATTADSAPDKEAVLALKEVSQAVDSDLDSALSTAASGHSFGNMITEDSASIFAGDFVANGYSGPILNHQHTFDNVRTSGTAKAFFGNQHGGKHIFDD